MLHASLGEAVGAGAPQLGTLTSSVSQMSAVVDRTTTPPIAAPRLSLVVPRPAVIPRSAPALEHRQSWLRRYRARVLLTDIAIVLMVTSTGALIQLAGVAGLDPRDAASWTYLRVHILTFAIWLLMLVLFQTRAEQTIGHGTTEYRRVVHATGMAFGVLAIGFVILQSQGLRTQLLVGLPVGIPALLLGRWGWRRWLVHQRQLGAFLPRALIVGRRRDVEHVAESVQTHNVAGYHVVGVTLDDDDAHTVIVGDRAVPALGSYNTVARTADQIGADTVIVASTPEDPDYLKQLSWQLEGTAAELVLSSPLTDIAGPRMSLHQLEGMPLVRVTIPTFEGTRYLAKRAMDIVLSSLALLAIGVATPFIALAIKLDSKGSVFFRQERVGRDGQTFRMVKFRSMAADAEERKADLLEQNDGAGPLFKMKDDPRVTRVGGVLRRFSLDELPQFWNVLRGDMSIVGPRPPLPSEVTAYDGKVFRRLYIRPGITGLWQVNGRSDLCWEESVRLDLRYVENWSVTGDLLLICRTAAAMVRPSGSY
jgi:exopolysaccharide biosynthesis polyprenyl glycosylphosphotransferase